MQKILMQQVKITKIPKVPNPSIFSLKREIILTSFTSLLYNILHMTLLITQALTWIWFLYHFRRLSVLLKIVLKLEEDIVPKSIVW